MKALLIALVYTLLLAGECQIESKSSSLAINGSCPCGNTSAYTMNVEDSQSLKNLSDEVKEAIKSVIGELIEKKIQAVVDNLENKIESVTTALWVQLKTDLKRCAAELANQSQQELKNLLYKLELPKKPSVTSCKSLPPSSPSGYYWIHNSIGDLNYQFCDMTRKCGCNGTVGGWMRVANMDMTNTSQQCPDGFRLKTSPKRTCGRMTPIEGCASILFLTNGHQYSQICGKIKAYQFGQPEGFRTGGGAWLVDGITLYTHKQSKHIWSFVAGRDEVVEGSRTCPCNAGHSLEGITINATIGQDYFCDTGSENGALHRVFYSDDPLWDGAGCGPRSACCSFNNPPWFCKQLPQPTTDDIELQMCGYDPIHNEDTPIEIVEIYIQ